MLDSVTAELQSALEWACAARSCTCFLCITEKILPVSSLGFLTPAAFLPILLHYTFNASHRTFGILFPRQPLFIHPKVAHISFPGRHWEQKHFCIADLLLGCSFSLCLIFLENSSEIILFFIFPCQLTVALEACEETVMCIMLWLEINKLKSIEVCYFINQLCFSFEFEKCISVKTLFSILNL